MWWSRTKGCTPPPASSSSTWPLPTWWSPFWTPPSRWWASGLSVFCWCLSVPVSCVHVYWMANNRLICRVSFCLPTPPATSASWTRCSRALPLPNTPSQAGRARWAEPGHLCPHLAIRLGGDAPLQLSSLFQDGGKARMSKCYLSFDGEGSGDKFDTRKFN